MMDIQQLKLEVFKTLAHPGKEIRKVLSDCKEVVEYIVDAAAKPDVNPKAAKTK